MTSSTTPYPQGADSCQDRRIRVYIVDDHPLIRKALTDLISAESDMYVCGDAATTETALSEITVLRPDVAIIDLSLNGQSGIELIKSVRGLEPRIGVLVVSMHSEMTHAMRAFDAGANGYVIKHDAPERILKAIRHIRGGAMFASGALTTQLLNRLRVGVPVKGADPFGALSERELEVAKLIGEGNTTNEIAVKLHVSIKTIETHRTHIKRKLQVENSMQLVRSCARWAHEQERAAEG